MSVARALTRERGRGVDLRKWMLDIFGPGEFKLIIGAKTGVSIQKVTEPRSHMTLGPSGPAVPTPPANVRADDLPPGGGIGGW
jgi:hypothetical protein